ncbi:hypothetical protein OWR29_26345 [Actinoplanes sp. Pm04-4]|uniref:Uncharacterized protein n=1 Tax=Paractinoplanes pyxinae TaxID=2997416 RepID=A0ABT4B4V8_9ACTN|nr:hypothetical protein [Actinoplanes pyxinae]MCY1141533.1 hypothetical protein [Actinoplanes pyxinae]
MESFDWSSLQVAQAASIDNVPEMVNHALVVLGDLLEDDYVACEFSLEAGRLIGDNVEASVNALLPGRCRVQRLEPAALWRPLVREALPEIFLPARQRDVWDEGTPPRVVAELLMDWAVALMSRLWPEDADCWTLTVEIRDAYAPSYLDVVIEQQEQVWLLHLGVTD